MTQSKPRGRPKLINSERKNIMFTPYEIAILNTKKNASCYIRRLIREDVERNKK